MEQQASVNIHEAKTHLSRLVERAAAGEEIVISKAGKPMARLVPLEAPAVPRSRGIWRGRVVIHDDFDELPDELVEAFSGEDQ
ncbi:MAG: type II toxin-antitoxin system Phd/YefM family antitoxin [Egibacteraceae bacterium]